MKVRFSPIVLALLPAFGWANDKPVQKDEHDIETLVISASPLKRTVLESATPVSILNGEELAQNQAATLGETLKNTPGVNSSYFGPVSSSPIIRGLDGPRIKIVQNGLDASDASRVGPDHSVATEVSTAMQIEVLRGPATLLYGSGAIGGVVNVVDNRLPQQNQDGLSGQVMGFYDTVANEKTVSTDLNGGAGSFAWHLDAFSRKTDNFEIPGPAELAHDEDEHDEENSGYLENSAIDAQGFTLGSGWITDDFRLALSYGRIESDYGVPGHAHEEHGAEEETDEHSTETEEGVYARLEQDRFQAIVDWNNLTGPFSAVHWHNGYTDYQHSEIEEGQVGTTFQNQTLESRLWAEHKPMFGWEGVIGLHFNDVEFSAIGEEAFTPPTDSQSLAMFVLEEKRTGDLLWQLGLRVEKVRHQPDNAFFDALAHDHEAHDAAEEEEEHEIHFDEQRYNSLSASAGVVWSLDEHQSLAFNYAYSQRAPSASETFAFGPHIGTGTYEIGGGFAIHQHEDEYLLEQAESKMNKEVSNNLDLTYRYHASQWHASVSLFYNQVDNYVFQQDTGLVISDGHLHAHDEEEDSGESEDGHAHGEDLPVFLFAQQDAKLYGFEAEMDWHFAENWRIDAFTDYTRAKLDDGSNVPRIPPLRIGSSLHFEYDRWHAEAGFTRYSKQDKYAEFESSTEGYTLVSASVNYYVPSDLADLTLFIKGDNLTDEEARVHSSFLKDVAPLPGRAIRFGIKGRF
ncbi:TonB-dependent receptor domain-containing protein [Bowmanella yangjiangensis]|uniref:TonB-dependent receptor n=1 Tax=Bowmanella yangjiangensis TaxID=2811230 RepID=A0ABS3CRF3_9ALTE|nr:TonB-dependent receptor [Bowmanella yangjiangensis]MBN7819688.1 TonB-dependent receptor [Bowmanella yangjiangensis]